MDDHGKSGHATERLSGHESEPEGNRHDPMGGLFKHGAHEPNRVEKIARAAARVAFGFLPPAPPPARALAWLAIVCLIEYLNRKEQRDKTREESGEQETARAREAKGTK